MMDGSPPGLSRGFGLGQVSSDAGEGFLGPVLDAWTSLFGSAVGSVLWE